MSREQPLGRRLAGSTQPSPPILGGEPAKAVHASAGIADENRAGIAIVRASPRRQHSRKPDEVYGRIERLVDGPYLEMFARNTRPGWDALGNEVGLFDQGSIKTRRWPSARQLLAAG